VESRLVMGEQEIEEALVRLAAEMLERNPDPGKLALVGIHTGGVFLAQRLRRRLEETPGKQVPLGTLDINLYRDDWTRLTHHPVVKRTELNFSIDGRSIVLVDDVLYTGRTVRAAMDALMDFGRPDNIQLAVLVDRGLRELPIQATYVGRQVSTTPEEQVYVYLKEHSGRDEVRVESLSKPQSVRNA
jgi:pyrimidine operon attenuation protein/uracil phosphoribosyltransferase